MESSLDDPYRVRRYTSSYPRVGSRQQVHPRSLLAVVELLGDDQLHVSVSEELNRSEAVEREVSKV